LSSTLVVDTRIKSVLCDREWVVLPPAEWNFLLRIAGPNWMTAGIGARNRKRAERLRQRIGSVNVELVRGHGYRLRGAGRGH
jgi:hypothetical protein